MPLRKATRFVGQEEVVAPLRKRCDGTSKSISMSSELRQCCSMRDPHGGLVLKRFRSCWHKFHRHVDHFKSSGRFTRSLRLEDQSQSNKLEVEIERVTALYPLDNLRHKDSEAAHNSQRQKRCVLALKDSAYRRRMKFSCILECKKHAFLG